MIKDIRYDGYTAVPSDYDCADGELCTALNLVNEDGALKAISPPRNVLTLRSDDKVLAIHRVSGQENWIIMRGASSRDFKIVWVLKEDDIIQNTEDAKPIECPQAVLFDYSDIAIIGNTLAIAVGSGVQYILWKDGDYKYLGNRPPFIPINWGAYKERNLIDSLFRSYSNVPRWTWTNYSGSYSSGANKPLVAKTEEDDIFWKMATNDALGLLLEKVSESVTSKGFFYQPFFLRYAFRLFDGSYYWHSAPILILCNPLKPEIAIECSEGIDESQMNISYSLNFPIFNLAYKIIQAPSSLQDWEDIVCGIDVFISAPMYTYNQSKDMGLPVNRYRFHGSVESKFAGHYADTINGEYVDHVNTYGIQDKNLVCSLADNENFPSCIETEHSFYKIASLELSELREGVMTKLTLKPNNTSADSIVTLPILSDEFNSHALVKPTLLHSYNGRLSMCGITMAPPVPFPMAAMAESSLNVFTGILQPTDEEVIRVYTRINGVKCVSEHILTQSDNKTTFFYPFNNSFPRFLYHPDPNAYKMVIIQKDKSFVLQLKQHPFLTGAYWYGGLGVTAENISTSDASEDDAGESAEVPNKIYGSEVNNPFVFAPSNIVTIACGRVLGISSAAKALSQGQFGQFPLYAFTDEGVWALEISPTGTISARQPITRDVCLVDEVQQKPLGITQIDSAVLFPTARGIMLLSGSNVQCISQSINTEKPFGVKLLPHISDAYFSIEKDFPLGNATEIFSFSRFLKNCRMIYDYIHQRIIVFNRDFPYAYLYSMQYGKWSTIYSTIRDSVDSYPDALAEIENGQVVDFCNESDLDNTYPSILITRPLKLDAPDVLKTVDTVIQRGNFRKGNVQSVLYGSRDLFNWHLVWSSKDHYLRGFRGTPYRYFRIALICSLESGESISGVSIQFTPRYTQQLR